MGYYKLRDRIDFQDLPISVEQDAGDKRYWTDESTGEEGCTLMLHPYGYIRGTLGTDGDEVDVYVGPNEQSTKVFVITQNQKPEEGKAGSVPWVETDEQKVMLGFDSAKEAQDAYLHHYDDPRFFGHMIELTMEDFKERLQSQKGELIKAGFSIGSNHPLLRESLRGTEQLGWFTDPDYLPPRTRLFIENNKAILKKPESDAQTKDLNDTNHRLARLNRKLKGTKVYKGLKDGRSLAIMLEDNIPMLVLHKSTADNKFNFSSPRSEEELEKNKEYPVSEDTSKGVSMNLSDELCKGFGYDDPTDFLYKFPSDSPLHKEAVKLMEECLALEKEMQKHSNDREKLWRKKDKLSLKKDELLLKQYRKDQKVSKSERTDAVDMLRKAQASLNEEEMDLKKQNEASKSQEEEEEEETEKSFDFKKALRALVVSGMSKRARMDAAYQLGQAASRNTPIDAEPAEVTNLNVGTDRNRPTHEPPVVPVRRVETPRGANQTVETMKSCSVHGYVHKSETPCPLCVQSGISEAKPYWRR